MRRTHPLTPVLRGWRVLGVMVAVIAVRNVAELITEFTWRRALIALLALALVLLVSVGLSAIAWWRTTYEVDADGVRMHSGLLTVTRRAAPREKIESVSITRPALARLLGLATVRIEVAGGHDSHLDIGYVRGRDAERLRHEILATTEPPAVFGHDPATVIAAAAPGSSQRDATRPSAVRAFLHDGVVDGELIAHVPTVRLLRSMLRDVSFMLGLAFALVWTVVSVVLGIASDGVGLAALAALVPVVLTVPRAVLQRVEGGWGFVSRLTPRGLRMRRGLFSTRTDAIAPGRVQELTLSQPLLWRRPAWVAARATVAGIGADDSANGASRVLPVGTPDELDRTLSCLIAPLGAADDLALVHAWLAGPARSLSGLRAGRPLQWVSRRTRVTVVLPGALLARRGILTRRLAIVPRERVQGIVVRQGPWGRALGAATLQVAVAGSAVTVSGLPLASAIAVRDELAPDAARGRRYGHRDAWPRPRTPLPAAPQGAGA